MVGNSISHSIGLHKFKRVPSNSFEDVDAEAEEGLIMKETRSIKKAVSRKSKIMLSGLTVANLGILSATVYLLCFSGFHLFHERNEDLKKCSYWSPILDDVEIPTYTAMMNGSLFATPEASIARQEPGPENDAAWHVYEQVLTHVVTRDEIIKLGKDPDTVARFDDEYWGLGRDAYMVQIDVMHQIHCLNLLRKAAFADYPGYDSKSDPHDKMWWIHLGHCVDILLQNLKCNANTDLLTLSWMEHRDRPWPDFSVNHQCRDFETLVKWQKEHAVDRKKFDRMPVPKDAYKWPAPWEHPDSELGHKLGQHHQQEGFAKTGGS